MNLKNALIDKITTMKDRSIKITLITPELDAQTMAELFLSVNNQVLNVDIPEDISEQKSKSQRLRAVLYRVWENKYKDKFNTFELFYNSEMERILEHYKNKID